jgi:hypothetical protein
LCHAFPSATPGYRGTRCEANITCNARPTGPGSRTAETCRQNGGLSRSARS